MDALDRPTIQRSAADLADEIKTRSADAAAEKLQPFGGAEIAGALLRLSPAFAQDVLAALPDETRERTLAAVPDEFARQWQRNAQYDTNTVGRMMEPVLAAFAPTRSVCGTGTPSAATVCAQHRPTPAILRSAHSRAAGPSC